jgi:SAM-dependent methyltransferase
MTTTSGHRSHHAATETEPYSRALEQMNRFQAPEGQAAIADLALPLGSRGLDVGCGLGLYTLWLAEAVGPGGSVVGIEPSSERVAAARGLVGGALPPGRLEFREGDGTAIGASDGAFDWLWCGDVLHHIPETATALAEFLRVVRPGGLIVVKESQVAPAMFLPGYPELERQLHAAEMEFHREEAGGRSFGERRQRTRESLFAVGLTAVAQRTYVIQRQAPLPDAAREYIQQVIFDRNWGERIRDRVTSEDWRRRSELCEAHSPAAVLARPDYYCLSSFTVFAARRPP